MHIRWQEPHPDLFQSRWQGASATLAPRPTHCTGATTACTHTYPRTCTCTDTRAHARHIQTQAQRRPDLAPNLADILPAGRAIRPRVRDTGLPPYPGPGFAPGSQTPPHSAPACRHARPSQRPAIATHPPLPPGRRHHVARHRGRGSGAPWGGRPARRGQGRGPRAGMGLVRLLCEKHAAIATVVLPVSVAGGFVYTWATGASALEGVKSGLTGAAAGGLGGPRLLGSGGACEPLISYFVGCASSVDALL